MLLTDLPADVLPLILFWLTHAVQIARAASVCKAWSAAGKKYHFIEPGPPMMARCKADTPLTSTFASLGLTGRVALNLGETA